MELETDSLTLTIVAEPPPLFTDANGVIRVGDTRVTLDTVVSAFEEGATAEEIVYQYPTLNLADVYAVLGYYLQRQAEVETYLRRRQQQGQVVRESNEARYAPQGIRERLLARRSPLRRSLLRSREGNRVKSVLGGVTTGNGGNHFEWTGSDSGAGVPRRIEERHAEGWSSTGIHERRQWQNRQNALSFSPQ